MMRPAVEHLSLPDAVLVAAAAAVTPPAELLAGADLTLLVLVTGRARLATTVAAAAAEVLVGVAAGRPFAHHNRAAAWALAAHVATVNRRSLCVEPGDAIVLLDDVERGRLDESGVAALLDRSLRTRPGRARRFLSAMFEVPPAPATIEWACPECGRAIPEAPHRSSAFLYKPLPDDVVRDCAARHRAHGPVGCSDSIVLAPLRRAAVLRRA
jgi:hypothetical protein